MTAFQPITYGKYLLVDRIARGGMAELFRGKIIGSKGFEKLVAIKKILPHLADQEEFVQAFIDEARLAAFLNHQNIVQIYDFGEMAGTYYLAMEYLSGRPLRALRTALKDESGSSKKLPLEIAVFIVAEVCAGLHYAHNLKDFSGEALNIIHRDINPQNVFITFDGQVKIIDFGIARATSHDTTTYVGSLKGKLSYMAPEQASGLEVDNRSDIFSAGIILYELVTGQRLYTGDSQQILVKSAQANFVSVRTLQPDLPQPLLAVLDKALAKDPQFRYQSAEEMRADLEQCLQEWSVQVSSHELASCIREFFTDEVAEEEEAIRLAATIESPLAVAEEEETVFIPGPAQEKETPTQKRLLFLFALFIALVAYGLVARSVYVDQALEHWTGVWSRNVSVLPLESNPHERAQRYFQKLLVQSSQGKSFIPKQEELAREASYLVEHYPDEALAIFKKVARQYPQLGQVHYYLGRLYTARQEQKKAIGAYLLAVRHDKGMADAYFNLGYLYAVQKNYLEAQRMYEQVVKLSPSYLDEALFNLAYIDMKLGQREKSITHLQQALELNPENKQAARLYERLVGKEEKKK